MQDRTGRAPLVVLGCPCSLTHGQTFVPLGFTALTLLMSASSHNISNSGGAFMQPQAFPWKETTKLLISSMRFCCQPS